MGFSHHFPTPTFSFPTSSFPFQFQLHSLIPIFPSPFPAPCGCNSVIPIKSSLHQDPKILEPRGFSFGSLQVSTAPLALEMFPYKIWEFQLLLLLHCLPFPESLTWHQHNFLQNPKHPQIPRNTNPLILPAQFLMLCSCKSQKIPEFPGTQIPLSSQHPNFTSFLLKTPKPPKFPPKPLLSCFSSNSFLWLVWEQIQWDHPRLGKPT